MKKLSATLVAIVLLFSCVAQTTNRQTARTMRATDSLALKNNWVNEFDKDTALAAHSDKKLATQKAVKDYVDNHAGGDTTAADIGINITQTGRKFTWRNKGAHFTSISALRSYTGTIDNTWVFVVSDFNGIRSYKYDASDLTTADDGTTCIVNGTKRLKLNFEEAINARYFGATPNDGTNDASALQAVINFAGSAISVTKRVLIADGDYNLSSSTITVPSNVTLVFQSARIIGTGTITGGIIDGPFTEQLFATTVTVHPDAVASMWSMKWGGAAGTGLVDDHDALQWCWTMCAFQNKIKHIWWPAGTYIINKGVLFERDDNADGSRDFPTGYIIEGESKAFGGSGEVVVNLHNDSSFALGFQKCKGFLIRNIYVDGGNSAIAAISLQNTLEGAGSQWNSTQRTQINSPSICFVVDPVGIPSMGAGTKYPDFVAKYSDPSSGGSTDIVFENCAAFNSIVGFGISVNGTTQNGDLVQCNSCWAYQLKYSFVTGSSQNRSFKINKCGVWGHVFTVIDCSTFGDNIGDPPQVEELNTAGSAKYLCNLNTFANNGLTINNSHFESIWSLGGCFTGESGKLTINNSWVAMSGAFLPGDGTALHAPKTMFRGSTLNMTNCFFSYYQSGTTPISIDAAHINLVGTGVDNILINNNLGNPTTDFDKCTTSNSIFPFGDGNRIARIDPNQIQNNNVLFTTDMEYILDVPSGDFYVSLTRKKVNRTLGQFGYGGKDYQRISLGSFTPSNVVAVNVGQSSSTADITLAAGSTELKILQIGDYLLTTTTDEYGRAGVLSCMGQIYAINTGTGVVSLKTTMIGLSAISYPVWLYRQPQLIPAFAVGDCTSGSNIITNVEMEGAATQFPPGATINSNYFPEGTYIVSYNSGTHQLTLSNNATATATTIDIISSDWQMVQYGYPNTSLSARLGYKQGDIIWNKRPDLNADVLFFICTKSGITNSSKLPTFRAFYKNMAPPLANDAAADVWGTTFYYNTTTSTHRIKNGSTWYDLATLTGIETFTNKTLVTPKLTNISTEFGTATVLTHHTDSSVTQMTLANVWSAGSPYSLVQSNVITTTSTTQATIGTLNMIALSAGVVEVTFIGLLNDGSDGTQLRMLVWYHVNGGTLTIDGTANLHTQHNGAGMGTPVFAATASGTNILLKVTPGNTTNTKWKHISKAGSLNTAE